VTVRHAEVLTLVRLWNLMHRYGHLNLKILVHLSCWKLFRISVAELKSELESLISHSCSLFTTAVPSCVDVFQEVISSWLWIHIIAPHPVFYDYVTIFLL